MPADLLFQIRTRSQVCYPMLKNSWYRNFIIAKVARLWHWLNYLLVLRRPLSGILLAHKVSLARCLAFHSSAIRLQPGAAPLQRFSLLFMLAESQLPYALCMPCCRSQTAFSMPCRAPIGEKKEDGANKPVIRPYTPENLGDSKGFIDLVRAHRTPFLAPSCHVQLPVGSLNCLLFALLISEQSAIAQAPVCWTFKLQPQSVLPLAGCQGLSPGLDEQAHSGFGAWRRARVQGPHSKGMKPTAIVHMHMLYTCL